MNAHNLSAHEDIVFPEVDLHLVPGRRLKALRLRQSALPEFQAKRSAELLQRAQARRFHADGVLHKPKHGRTVSPAVVEQLSDSLQIRLQRPPRQAVMALEGNISLKAPYCVAGDSRHPRHCLNSMAFGQ